MTLQCQIFRIFANSANKRQTTVIINQLLTQKWLLLQNFISSEDSSYFRNRVFNNGKWRCCLFDRILTKISKFKLKQVYATKNTLDIRPKSQSLL
jgi:hypothetical protein